MLVLLLFDLGRDKEEWVYSTSTGTFFFVTSSPLLT